MIKFGEYKYDYKKVLSKLKFKEIDLPIFSQNFCEYPLQERLSHRGYILTCKLFNDEISNEYLLGATEILVALLADEKEIDRELRESLVQLEIIISNREIA